MPETSAVATQTASAVTTSLIRIRITPSCQLIGQVRSKVSIGAKRAVRTTGASRPKRIAAAGWLRLNVISAGLADRAMAASSGGNRGIHGSGHRGVAAESLPSGDGDRGI